MRGANGNDSVRRILIGQVFQWRFRIESVLGEGGMGRVFAAHDLNLDRPVAIKMLHTMLEHDDSSARFMREAQVLARLSSENTVRVHEVGHDQRGVPYIVMERVAGRSLDSMVAERGPLPVAAATEFTRQVCLALAEAHAYGIVHRDIKPGNILVDESGIRGPLVKLVDFGVAKARSTGEDASGLTSMSALLGTPEYMSPEQLRSSREVDHRTDIWALGATLYFMLVGRPPFAAPDLRQLMDVIQHGATPSVGDLRPDVPSNVEEVVARCLHRDPLGRYGSVADVVRALGVATGWSDRLPSLDDDDSENTVERTAIIRTQSSPEIDEPTKVAEQRPSMPPGSARALPPPSMPPPSARSLRPSGSLPPGSLPPPSLPPGSARSLPAGHGHVASAGQLPSAAAAQHRPPSASDIPSAGRIDPASAGRIHPASTGTIALAEPPTADPPPEVFDPSGIVPRGLPRQRVWTWVLVALAFGLSAGAIVMHVLMK